MFYTFITVFYWKNKDSKNLNRDVQGTSMRPSCGMSPEPNDEMLWGRLRDVGHTCFLNRTHEHIKLILTGYSRLHSEFRGEKFSEQYSD